MKNRKIEHYGLKGLEKGSFSKLIWDFQKWTKINVQN
jgi:hypothetical protein